jgi:hypothetical protein
VVEQVGNVFSSCFGFEWQANIHYP